MPTTSFHETLMLNRPMDFDEYIAIAKDQEFEIVKQEFPKKNLIGKLVCFFCDEEFENVDVLHSHQNKCSSVCDIQTVLANAKSSRNEKRGFLSQLNLVSKGKAEHLRSAKRKDVVVDVIVIDGNSDDEDAGAAEDRSLHCDQTPLNCSSKSSYKKICTGKSCSNGQLRTGRFTRQSWKVLKFAISSPLGMRLRYDGSCTGSARLPYSRIVNNYEQYCGNENSKASKTSDSFSDGFYPVTFRKTRLLKYTHRYKFTRRQLREFCKTKKYGLNVKSRKLKQQMKPCSIELEKLDLYSERPKTVYDIADYMHLLPSKSFADDGTTVGGMVSSSDKFCKPNAKVLECPKINALTDLASKLLYRSATSIDTSCKTVSSTLTSVDTCLNSDCKFVMYSTASHISCPSFSDTIATSSHLQTKHNSERNFSRGSVNFVPLSALCEQTFDEDMEWEGDVCQISSVFSLAETSLHDDVTRKQVGNEEASVHCTVENSDFSANNLLPRAADELMMSLSSQLQKLPDVESAEANSCNISNGTTSCHHQTPRTAVETATVVPVANSNFIDLTEPSMHYISDVISRPSSRENRSASNAVTANISASGDSIISSKPLTNQCEIPNRQINAQFVTNPVVIEIPDEDIIVTSSSHQLVDTQELGNPNMPTSAITRHCNPPANSHSSQPISNILGQLSNNQPKNPHHCSTSRHSAVQSKDGDTFRNGDLIDLCADSDCEFIGSDSSTSTPKPSNSVGDGQVQKAEAKMLHEDSSLPPLTFKCHICSCLFEFGKNCSALIKSHYLTHNVTNIELIKHRLPNGQSTWSIVEFGGNPTPRFPSYPMTNSQKKHDFGGPVFRPMAPCYASPFAVSVDGNSVDHERSSVIMRTLEQSQRSNVACPPTGVQSDKVQFGCKGGSSNLENCWRQPRGRNPASCGPNYSVAMASGDGVALLRGHHGERKPVSEGHAHGAGVGPKPRFQQSSFVALHIFPRPDFLERPACDRESDIFKKMAELNSTLEPMSSTISTPMRSSTGSENLVGRGNLVQENHKEFGSFNNTPNCTQSVICLD